MSTPLIEDNVVSKIDLMLCEILCVYTRTANNSRYLDNVLPCSAFGIFYQWSTLKTTQRLQNIDIVWVLKRLEEFLSKIKSLIRVLVDVGDLSRKDSEWIRSAQYSITVIVKRLKYELSPLDPFLFADYDELRKVHARAFKLRVIGKIVRLVRLTRNVTKCVFGCIIQVLASSGKIHDPQLKSIIAYAKDKSTLLRIKVYKSGNVKKTRESWFLDVIDPL